PKPEPSPRPIRFLRWREPAFGFRLCSPISSVVSSAIDLHQVGNLRQHATQDLAVLLLGGTADLAKAKRAQRVALLRVGPVGRLDLRVLHGAHASTGSTAVSSSAASGSFGSRPRTSAIVRPRSSATCFGSRRSIRPCIVALTRLIGFWEP